MTTAPKETITPSDDDIVETMPRHSIDFGLYSGSFFFNFFIIASLSNYKSKYR